RFGLRGKTWGPLGAQTGRRGGTAAGGAYQAVTPRRPSGSSNGSPFTKRLTAARVRRGPLPLRLPARARLRPRLELGLLADEQVRAEGRLGLGRGTGALDVGGAVRSAPEDGHQTSLGVAHRWSPKVVRLQCPVRCRP